MPVALLEISSVSGELVAPTTFQLNVTRLAGALTLYADGARTLRASAECTTPLLLAAHVPAQATNAPPLDRIVFDETETFAELAHTLTAASGVGASPLGARRSSHGRNVVDGKGQFSYGMSPSTYRPSSRL